MTRLEDDFARALKVEAVRVAFYLGVPGAYRKITAQVTNSDVETLAFAKISASQVTERLIDYERDVLLRLADSEGLRGMVPRVLHAFDWQGSRTLLITEGPFQPGPRRLSGAHLELCGRIFFPFARRIAFGRGPMMKRTSRRLNETGPDLPGPLRSRFLWGTGFKSLDDFNSTPGEQGGRYLSDSEKDQVLTESGIPASQESR